MFVILLLPLGKKSFTKKQQSHKIKVIYQDYYLVY